MYRFGILASRLVQITSVARVGHFVRLLRIPVSSVLQRARDQLRAGSPFEGLKSASEALQSDVENMDALLVHGQCQESMGNYELALSDYAQVIEREPNNWDAFVGSAQCHFALGDIDTSLQEFDRVLSAQPDHIEALAGRAETSLHLRDMEKADADFAHILRLNPKYEYAYLGRAHCLLSMGRGDECLPLLAKCIELYPKSSPAHVLLASLHFQNGDYEPAIQSFNSALEFAPKIEQIERPDGQKVDVEVRELTAEEVAKMVEADNQDTSRTPRSLRGLVDISPANVLCKRGWAHLMVGDMAAALKDAEEAFAVNRDYIPANLVRGQARMAVNQLSEAVDDFTVCVNAWADRDNQQEDGPVLIARLGRASIRLVQLRQHVLQQRKLEPTNAAAIRKEALQDAAIVAKTGDPRARQLHKELEHIVL